MRNPRERFEDIDLFLLWDDYYYKPYANKFYDAIIDYTISQFRVPPGEMIMDAGCGPGAHTLRFLRRGFKCWSIDFSDTALVEAQKRIEGEGFKDRVNFSREDVTRLTFPSESFPYIFCWGVIMHIPQAEKAIDELSRILKPGGSLALSVNNANSLDKFLLENIAYKFKRPKSLKAIGTTNMGRYLIFDEDGQELFVQGLFMDKVKDRFEQNGLTVTAYLGAQASELYINFQSDLVRKIFAYLNLFWFKHIRIPYFCNDQLLILRKPL